MDQVYIVGAPEGATRPFFYRYGRFCYMDKVQLSPVRSAAHLPRLLRELQEIQGKIKYISEVDVLPDGSEFQVLLAKLELAMDYIQSQLLEADSVLQEALESNDWVDADNSEVYMEFEMHNSYKCHTADIIIAKKYVGGVIITAVYYQNRFLVSLADASAEQHLVDTQLPSMSGRKRGFQVCAFDHSWFSKLSVWEADGAADDEEDSDEDEDADAKGADSDDDVDSGITLDVAGIGYTQTYIVGKPKHLDEGSTARDVFFRFGNWCYSGSVDLTVPSLALGDVPEVLPALQKQQSMLAYTCETVAVPVSSPYAPVLVELQRALKFFEDEIIASEAHLAKMSEIGVTSWIEEDWGAAFFELSVAPGEYFKDLELIAGKRYSRGVIFHSVFFQGSLYAVLSATDDDQPLLDVAFPDVTARCRGYQIKTYNTPAGPGLTPRRLSVWEGRRRGAVGVGWGSGAALAIGGMAVPKDGSITAGLRKTKTRVASGPTGRVVEKGESKGGDSDSKTAAAADESKMAETPKPKATAAAQVTPKKKPASESKAAGGGKEDDGESKAAASTTGAGAGAGAGSPAHTESYGVRAPHHLPPMGGLGRLKTLPSAKGPAPWDSTGRPLLGKSVLK